MEKEDTVRQHRELDEFQLRNIRIMTALLAKDCATDELLDYLREIELDYYSLQDKYHLLEKNSNIDEKTKLLKYKEGYLTNIVKTASRIFFGIKTKDYHISFIRIDIDDFSVFNNKYGHAVGDEVLVNVANLLKNTARPTDYVIRFGGEEFDVILPSTTLDGAKIFADKILSEVRALKIEHNGKTLGVTISCGLSTLKYIFDCDRMVKDIEVDQNFKQLQQEADNALYESKYLGKNRYSTFTANRSSEYEIIRKMYSEKAKLDRKG